MAALDLSRPQHVHIVAIGGAAMNAMAQILHSMGHHVTGSHDAESPVVQHLRAVGIDVAVGHDASHVGGADLVAVSTAVPDENPEVIAARAAGIPVITRPELQGAICTQRDTVAVGGTHGKTTTTAMLALALRDAGLAPSFIVGGVVHGLGTGTAWSDGGPLVVEADESDGTFLTLGAHAVVVTNVEADHLDHWGSFDNLRAGFVEFVRAAPGPKVLCADDPGAASIAHEVPGCVTYGTGESADYRIVGSTLRCPDGDEHPLTVPTPGLHNVRNAAAAFAMADLLGADRAAVAGSLAVFPGVARRWEVRGEAAGVTFVDSYDHLPTEVRAVLAAAREGTWERIVCVFQPHRYTRTRDLHAEFGPAFDDADVVAVTDIYAAGQQPIPGVTGKLVVDAILSQRPWKRVAWLPGRLDLRTWLLAELRPGDLCLTLGAGDLTSLPDELLEAILGRAHG